MQFCQWKHCGSSRTKVRLLHSRNSLHLVCVTVSLKARHAMPFSKEETARIKVKLADSLSQGRLNNWEQSFLSDMKLKFDLYGPRTRLTSTQYKKLSQLLGLREEQGNGTVVSTGSAPRKTFGTAPIRAVPKHSHSARNRSAYKSKTLMGSIYAPKRALRRASRAVMLPIVLVMAVLAMFSAGFDAFNSSGSGGTSTQTSSGTVTNVRMVQAREIRVLDGDTVSISGERANIRLVGFNAPETQSPECSAELQAGRSATARLNALIGQAQDIEYRRVACACSPGTEGTDRCNFGRQCGSLIVDGADVGRTLISENLAVPYQCGRTSCPPRPGSWCH